MREKVHLVTVICGSESEDYLNGKILILTNSGSRRDKFRSLRFNINKDLNKYQNQFLFLTS